jgi:hypothetical protein
MRDHHPLRALGLSAALALAWAGCAAPSDDPRGADQDGDGFSANAGDCADLDPARRPGAEERCNQVDDNCDGRVDEQFDLDQDGHSSCNGGDCKDDDPTAFPGGVEVTDGLDNDCDGEVDEDTPERDDDGDGFSDIAGDCDDDPIDPDAPLVNPAAVEVAADGADNDCDGAIDEAPTPCDAGLDPADPVSFARAMGLCGGEVISAEFVGPSDPAARAIVGGIGESIAPAEGAAMVYLSTGLADEQPHLSGTDFGANFPHPAPHGNPNDGCGEADHPLVHDYTEYKLRLRAPSNARAFRFRFQFMSTEYPTYRCSNFDDTFLALMTSEAYAGNISFDANGNVVSINSGFLQICGASVFGNHCVAPLSPALDGTGFSFGSEVGGATLPLSTFAPVEPGEILTLRLILYDEGDGVLDTGVWLDGFAWQADPVEGGPITIP